MKAVFIYLVGRDLKLAFRRRAGLINPIIFFLLVSSLFPLAISPDRNVLQMLAPGVIWVAALLSSMLSLQTIFRSDYEDGSLEQLILSRHPLAVLAFAKVFAHWLISGFPLLLITPVIGIILNLQTEALGILLVTLLLGTPVLSLVGGIGAALTVGLQRGGVLLSLLVIPFYIPVLIFGASAVEAAGAGLSVYGHISLLASFLVLAITLTPLAMSSALRISMY